jgi:hypothetical protein
MKPIKFYEQNCVYAENQIEEKKIIKLSNICVFENCKLKRSKTSLNFCKKHESFLKELYKRLLNVSDKEE